MVGSSALPVPLRITTRYLAFTGSKLQALCRRTTAEAGGCSAFMDKFVIRGGNPLVGTIRVSGAKNSALPCMAAAILTEDEVTLENIPQVRDIETERKLLASMGAEVELARRPRAATAPRSVAARSPIPSPATRSSRPCAPARWCWGR